MYSYKFIHVRIYNYYTKIMYIIYTYVYMYTYVLYIQYVHVFIQTKLIFVTYTCSYIRM